MHGLQPVPTESIWLPNGKQLNLREFAAARAVEQYDADLLLGQFQGQWTVFLRKGPEGQPFPVLGLGFELPSPDEITKKLFKADTKRHGGKIADRVDRHNEAVKRAARKKADQAAAEAAEYLAWGHRKLGGHDKDTAFVPGDK